MRILIACLAVTFVFTGCSGDDNEAFCDAARAFSNFDPAGGDGLEEAQDAFQELADTAPDEIADDAQEVADAFAAAAGGDTDQISQESVTAASDSVQSYAEENCDDLKL